MDRLEILRNEIDEIDKELVRLYEKRMETVLQVGQYKKEKNIPVLNASREKEVIEKNVKHLKNKEYEKQVEDLFLKMMEDSKKLQERDKKSSFDFVSPIFNKALPINIGAQGVKGSFSEEAVIEYFGEGEKVKFFTEFEDVFLALQKEEIDYGVLPIENSTTGGIKEVYALLEQYGAYIVGERSIKIEHHLIGIKDTKLEDIKEVYSHTQAFLQSNHFFKEHPHWQLMPYFNTATSVKLVKDKNSKEKVAVASKRAAKIYGLEIIKDTINTLDYNYTRFIVIGREPEIKTSSDKISIILSTEHHAGALSKVLDQFAKYNLNMSKIESRPVEGRPWEYYFYIDFGGNLLEEDIKKALEHIKDNSKYFKFLGNYKEDKLEMQKNESKEPSL